MKSRRKKKMLIVVLLALVIVTIFNVAKAGYDYGWGPFKGLHEIKVSKHKGNDEKFGLDYIDISNNCIMPGKRVLFLGSSVTYGSASKGISFADYIGQRNGWDYIKEAVPGTTLVNSGSSSYMQRLFKIDKSESFDLVIVQLSTNDASQKKPIGTVNNEKNESKYDDQTILGAIETIIDYCQKTWQCDVVFFTNPRYESAEYETMVKGLIQIADKWNIEVINMWDDEAFNNITKEQYDLYMYDKIHPTRAGYLMWWTPYMEQILENYLEEKE